MLTFRKATRARESSEAAQSNAAVALFIEEGSLVAELVRYKDLRTTTEKHVKRKIQARELRELLS